MSVSRGSRASGAPRLSAASALAAAVLSVSAPALADPDSGVDALLYRPSIDAEGMWSLESDRLLPPLALSWKVESGFGLAPLELAVPGIGGNDADDVLTYVLTFNMVTALGLTDWLTVAFDAAIYRTDTSAGYGERSRYMPGQDSSSTGLISLRPLSNIDPSGGFEPQGLSGPLDARAGFKVSLLGDATSTVGLALLGMVRLPFGNEEMFLGDSNLAFEPKLAFGWHRGSLAVLANVGAVIRNRSVLEAYDPGAGEMKQDARAVLDIGSELTGGIGVLSRVLPQLALVGEVNVVAPLPDSVSLGDCRLFNGASCDSLNDSDYFNGQEQGDLTAFSLLGVEYGATENISIRIAGGTGFLGERSETFRALAGVTWQPGSASGSRVGKDRDRDEVRDVVDVCADEPEDRDGFQDEDGCPELDNDGDGVLDANDTCSSEPEDKDGFQDRDGCPEPDNDRDGVFDVLDTCIDQKEDKDGFADDDGCPDEDNDGDNVADATDRCPNDPETVNGYEDDDGCPDARETGGPTLGADRIDLSGARIEFTGASTSELNAASTALLTQVADVIKRSNVQVRIEVHVPLGTRSSSRNQINRAQQADKQLSERRARAILRYLVDRGRVPLADLQAVGLGSARPRGDIPPTDPGQARVEFILIRQVRP